MQKNAYARKKKSKKAWKSGVLAGGLVMLLLLGLLGIQIYRLKEKDAGYAAREAELESQIAAENERTEELNLYAVFTKTLKYIEEIAREKLGLVYPDEIIVEPE